MVPSITKDSVITIDGVGYAGKGIVKRADLTRKVEEHRAGGMSGAIKIDLGQEAMTMEITLTGHDTAVYRQYGAPGAGQFIYRVNSSVESDDISGKSEAIEEIARGRIVSIVGGEKKPGEIDTTVLTVEMVSYKLFSNNQEVLHIDNENSIFVVNGVDLLEQRRKNLKI